MAILRIAHKLFVLADRNFVMSVDEEGKRRTLLQETSPMDGACCLGSACDFLLVGGLDTVTNSSWLLICDSELQPKLLTHFGSSKTKSAPRKIDSFRFNLSSLVLLFFDDCIQLMRLAVSRRSGDPSFEELFIIEGHTFARGASCRLERSNQLVVIGGDDKMISAIRISF